MIAALKSLGFSVALSTVLIGGGSQAFGSDSSTDVPGGFGKVVSESKAMILRVPINAQGDEQTSAAEIRVSNVATATGADIKAAFERGVDGSAAPQITSEDISRDSSTYGWYRYNYGGWYNNYYYNYHPYYYNSGYYYNYYGNPYSYNYYYPYNYYWGYRYYYYPRYW